MNIQKTGVALALFLASIVNASAEIDAYGKNGERADNVDGFVSEVIMVGTEVIVTLSNSIKTEGGHLTFRGEHHLQGAALAGAIGRFVRVRKAGDAYTVTVTK